MGVGKINNPISIDFIKARWRIITVSIVVGLVVILVVLYVVGLLILPSEVTSSCGGITYHTNSTGITEMLG
jgi:hypothetical protein